jgi:protein O-GlcNAc transferase
MATLTEAFAAAFQHYQAGRLELAEEICRRIVVAEPQHAEAWHLLGAAAHQRGDQDQAVACVQRAIQADGGKGFFFNTLGEAYRSLGKPAEAVACYERAIAIGPEHAAYHQNLGLARQTLGQCDAAVASLRRAVELQPDLVAALANLGTVLHEQGNLTEAIGCYERALALAPGLADVHCALGNARKDQGREAEAAACYRRAVELNPRHVAAWNNLGAALRRLEQPTAAEACCRRALELVPDLAEAHGNLGNALKDQGRLDEAVACCRRAVELKPSSAAAHSNLVYLLQFCPDCDPETLRAEQQRWHRAHGEPWAGAIVAHANDRTPERRLRVGYVSPNFCDHVVGRNLVPLLREHDHQAVEVFCYSDVRTPDAFTKRLRSGADVWRSIVGQSDAQVAQRIRDDRIDVLVDLALHLDGNRLTLFARKPAPVQATFAGYPGSTGLRTIDYRLTDPYLDPPGLNDQYYVERSLCLRDSFWCYAPSGDEPPVNGLPALERGCVTFGCLNNFCKVNPSVLRLWARVLRAVDGSRLVLLAAAGSYRQRILDLLAAEGVASDRVSFVVDRPHDEYLQLYQGIDLGLDTFPYNGHTTSLDSFWMGVPVVTLVGRTAVGRAGLSQLTNLGLVALAAESPAQFVDTAVQLAGDLPRLAELRATLRARMQGSPLMDAPRFARSIEAAYRAMWHHWCNERP